MRHEGRGPPLRGFATVIITAGPFEQTSCFLLRRGELVWFEIEDRSACKLARSEPDSISFLPSNEVLMRFTRAASFSTIAAISVLLSSVGPPSWSDSASARSRGVWQVAHKSTSTARFSLDQSNESTTDFALILSEGEETAVSGTFFIGQLYTLRDLLLEAKKFAFTDEAAGKDEPITTRFSNKEERAFTIDVSKRGNQSQFFVTIKTLIGQMTVDAGTVNRTDKKEEGLLFDMLKRVQLMIAKSTGQPANSKP